MLGYEVSRPRAKYAQEKLGLSVIDELSALDTNYEVFFSSHVLEHVPAPQQVIDLAKRVTQSGGIFVAFTPNGSRPKAYANSGKFPLPLGLSPPQHVGRRVLPCGAREDCPKLFSIQPVRFEVHLKGGPDLRTWSSSCGATNYSSLRGWRRHACWRNLVRLPKFKPQFDPIPFDPIRALVAIMQFRKSWNGPECWSGFTPIFAGLSV